MRSSLQYALLFSIPAGTTLGSGFYLITRQQWLGLTAGFVLGFLVFGFVLLGREYGSVDERLAEAP